MVRTKKALHRAAFTLIELIFAIIIMSIAIVSLPMMMQINSDGVERGIVQEAIFAASAELMGATTYYWDGRSTEDFNLSRYSRVVDVDGDCNADRQRLGHINRRCLDSSAAGGVNYTTEDNATFGLNRSVHGDETMFDSPEAEAAGYKQNYTSLMGIAQGLDINGLASNNVKVLTVSVFDTTPVLLTRLRIYSANVGEVEYYKRRF